MQLIFPHFRGLDDMTASKRHSGFFKVVNLSEMVGCLEDLITYFAQPEEELSKLLKLYSLKDLSTQVYNFHWNSISRPKSSASVDDTI
jgi:hypothetical protein